MLSQLEQACKTYSTKSSSGLIEFDSNWQRIYVTAMTFVLDQAISTVKTLSFRTDHPDKRCKMRSACSLEIGATRVYAIDIPSAHCCRMALTSQ